MLFILLLALILFGPKRLPEIARQVGKFVAEFKRASNDFKYQLQAEIDKAGISEPQRAQQSSPSIPTLLPAADSTAAGTASPQPADSGRTGDPESEHERLMKTARMAYEAQAFTLRPPEPPPVPREPQPLAAEPSYVPPQPEEGRTEAPPAEPVSLPSAPTGDSQPQSPQSGQIGDPAAQRS